MRIPWLALVILVLPVATNSARADRRGALWVGWEDKIEHIADLPPQLRAELKKQTNHDLAIGYCYRRCFVFGGGFAFWTWNGRHVLFHGDEFYELTEDEFSQLIGQDEFDSLGKPIFYRVPVGLVTVIILITVSFLLIRRMPEYRARARRGREV